MLEIGQDATATQVRKAYLTLAILVHPDKCDLPQSAAAFQALTSAVEKLQSGSANTVSESHEQMPAAEEPPIARPDASCVRLESELRKMEVSQAPRAPPPLLPTAEPVGRRPSWKQR